MDERVEDCNCDEMGRCEEHAAPSVLPGLLGLVFLLFEMFSCCTTPAALLILAVFLWLICG